MGIGERETERDKQDKGTCAFINPGIYTLLQPSRGKGHEFTAELTLLQHSATSQPERVMAAGGVSLDLHSIVVLRDHVGTLMAKYYIINMYYIIYLSVLFLWHFVLCKFCLSSVCKLGPIIKSQSKSE